MANKVYEWWDKLVVHHEISENLFFAVQDDSCDFGISFGEMVIS